ncbi:UDP-N-acetylglucosamine 2-epimerase [Nitrosopumilus sp. b2]|uniref:UDP-N-acetylglucosamine 2-epimerase n=1 Tax=Nitrosopumilus sp. b2 TaxID=2109908 RepID=UPI0015F3CB7F|nr:UDP-N-acetylglucosamine 2-epimerase [Nitrosopumilus sp. b2]
MIFFKKKILIVTERRADYTKFRPIIKEIEKSKKLDYFLIVTGSHLLSEYKNTIDEIYSDGFKIKEKFQMYSKNRKDTGGEMARSLGNSIIQLTNIIEKLNPDIILSGFDIGSNLGVAIVGAHMNKVVAHLEGGEVTGTIDESIRHATTKFAHIHFTTNEIAKKRLIKMGENPKLIFTVGNPSLDSIKNIEKIPVKELEKEFELDLKKPFVLVLQHTVTTEADKGEKNILETLQAIKELSIQAVIIHGNADFGSSQIKNIIKKSKLKHYTTLSFAKYINLLRHASALVGNSSSGKMEAPFLHIPTINIGTRQEGRVKAKSVIDVDYNKKQIKKAIQKAILDKKFLESVKKEKSPYGKGDSAKKLVSILEKIDLEKISRQKKLGY